MADPVQPTAWRSKTVNQAQNPASHIGMSGSRAVGTRWQAAVSPVCARRAHRRLTKIKYFNKLRPLLHVFTNYHIYSIIYIDLNIVKPDSKLR